MTPGDRRRVEHYWAGDLNIETADLARRGVRVSAHRLDYRGAQLLRHAEACILAVPPGWREHVGHLQGTDADPLFQPEALRRLFGDAVDRVIGPAFVGYLGAEPAADPEVRALTAADVPALERLRDACTAEEWEHAGIEPGGPDVFGLVAAGEVACAGRLALWGAELADLGILTHPAFRGRGLGRRVVRTMAAAARSRGYVPQYRTLYSNAGSLAVGKAAGFREWGRTLAVRLRGWAPEGVPGEKPER